MNQGVDSSSADNRLSEFAIPIQQAPTSNIDPETNNKLRPFVVYSAHPCKHRDRRHIKSVYDSSSNFLSSSLFVLNCATGHRVLRAVECAINRREVLLGKIMGQYRLTSLYPTSIRKQSITENCALLGSYAVRACVRVLACVWW